MSEKKRGSPQDVPPNNRIIVHNLPFETDEVALKEYFSKYGSVSLAEIPIVRGKPSGFGFVTFSSIEEATKANDPENKHTLEGRALRTNFAMKSRDAKRGEASSSSEEETKGKKLYVGKLPKETSETELRQFFEKFGKVEDAFLATVKYAPELNGYPQHKGYGFVSFENEEDANKVVKIKEHTFKGAEIFVKKALPQQEEKKGRRRDRERGERGGERGGEREGKSREGGSRRERGGNREGGHKEGGHSHSPKEGGRKEGGHSHDHKHGHKEGGHSHKEGGHSHDHKHGHSHSPKEGSHDHKHGHSQSPKEGEKGSSSPPTTKNQNHPQKSVPKKSGLHFSVANKPVQVDPKSLVNPWKKIESTQGATTNDDYPTLGKGKASKKATSEDKGKQEVEKN